MKTIWRHYWIFALIFTVFALGCYASYCIGFNEGVTCNNTTETWVYDARHNLYVAVGTGEVMEPNEAMERYFTATLDGEPIPVSEAIAMMTKPKAQ